MFSKKIQNVDKTISQPVSSLRAVDEGCNYSRSTKLRYKLSKFSDLDLAILITIVDSLKAVDTQSRQMEEQPAAL